MVLAACGAVTQPSPAPRSFPRAKSKTTTAETTDTDPQRNGAPISFRPGTLLSGAATTSSFYSLLQLKWHENINLLVWKWL